MEGTEEWTNYTIEFDGQSIKTIQGDIFKGVHKTLDYKVECLRINKS